MVQAKNNFCKIHFGRRFFAMDFCTIFIGGHRGFCAKKSDKSKLEIIFRAF
jgi:hypothetical protein